MALRLAEAAFDFTRRRRRWFLLAAVSYAAYRAYHLPSVAHRRRKLSLLLRALVSLADVVVSSSETLCLVSSDLNCFLRSDSDQLPPSLIQISKLARSDEVSVSVSRVSEALTIGIVRGLAKTQSESEAGLDFSGRVLEKLFSDSGKGFASVVVGSFARNLVLAVYSTESDGRRAGDPSRESVPEWVRWICDDNCRKLMADCVQLFVSSAVSMYLEKTIQINAYDELFSGLTNPKHEAKVKDILVSVCNGAVETLVKASHQAITSTNSGTSANKVEELKKEMHGLNKFYDGNLFDDKVKESGGWVDKVSSTLGVPSNTKFVLDVTGRVTFETVRSFLDFILCKLHDGARKGIDVIREEVLEVLRYVSAKSMAILTVCLTFCMQLMVGTKFLMPA